MKSILKILFVLSVGITATLYSCSDSDSQTPAQRQQSDTRQNQAAAVQSEQNTNTGGPKAPDFTLRNSSGKEIRLSDYKGKVVILDFWATWCGPCRMEIPSFVEMRENYNDKGLEIIGVSLDRDGWQAVNPFVQQYKINYPIVLGTQQIVADYGGINAIPTTFIINKNGEIVDKVIGYKPKSYFENTIQKLLNS
ncbi:MAG: TlpA disulfide reductase family protein [Calditrichia bacterium]